MTAAPAGGDERIVRVALVQAAGVAFDAGAAVERTSVLVGEAAAPGADLIVLPEAFVGGYPRGLAFGTVVGDRSPAGRALWARYAHGAIEVPSAATERLGRAARDAGAFVGVGVVERDAAFARGTLYCSYLLFSPEGVLLSRHRKLKPTGAERYIWGEGDGSTLKVVPTRIGRIAALICWENYMPLARMALYAQGVEVYLAPTADSREGWQATLRHIALEGRCFVVGCNQYVPEAAAPGVEGERPRSTLSRGGSAVYGPLGACLVEPRYDTEAIVHVNIDLQEVAAAKFDFDVAGHYARPDVFAFAVNDAPQVPLRLRDRG